MERTGFDEKELEIIGSYPAYFNSVGIPASEEPKLNYPITPKENLKMAVRGEKPFWIPYTGWIECDVQVFRPRLNPDNYVTHLVFDGGAPYTYESNSLPSSWYDLVWDFVPQANGATVHPGNPKVKDISEWEGCKADNQEFVSSGKMVQLGILSGFWERLMSILDVENAAVALIDEDQQEGVHRFLSQHADMLIEYVDRMTKILPIDGVLVHDDWGHQNGPFFSASTCMEMIVPYLKKLVDFCHSKGLIFELHSCGSNATNIPCMIAAGVDMWFGQPALNDFDILAEKYKDEPILFGLAAPTIAPGTSEEEVRRMAREWVLKHKEHHISLYRSLSAPIHPVFSKSVYEYSRKLYAGEEF